MSATEILTPTIPTSHELLELGNRLYREFHTRCFWHCPRDLVVTEDLIPFVMKGLRIYGGRRGYLLAGKLQAQGAPLQTSERELLECR